MWLAGPERARLYLGSQLALLQIAGQELLRLPHAPTVPQAAVLEQLAQTLKARGGSLQNLRIEVDLGASLCRGAVFSSAPSHLTGPELPQALQNELAGQIPWSVQQCQLPSGLKGISVCPVISQALLKSLEAWASTERAGLIGIQALWTLVTQSQRAQAAAIDVVALQEPDGLVLFRQVATPSNSPSTAIWQWLPGANLSDSDEVLLKALQQHGLHTNQVARFKFLVQAQAGSELGLKAWPGHWSLG